MRAVRGIVAAPCSVCEEPALCGSADDSGRVFCGDCASSRDLKIDLEPARSTSARWAPLISQRPGFDRERALEQCLVERLLGEGESPKRQVETAAGIADVVTDDAVYEVKLGLTRAALFSAAGQVTAYAACLRRSRRVIFGYAVAGTDDLIDALEIAGIEVMMA